MVRLYLRSAAAAVTLGLVLAAGCARPAVTSVALSALGPDQWVETRVNTFAPGSQSDPSIAADSSGNLLIVWASRRQEQGTSGVYAQCFDPCSRRLGTELHISRSVQGMQACPAVAYGDDDVAWVVWESDPADGESSKIVARQFGTDANGVIAPRTDEFVVYQSPASSPSNPAVTANDRGDVLVAWTADQAGRRMVMGRVYGGKGNAGDAFVLGACSAGRESSCTLSRLTGGRFVAAWARTDADNRPDRVVARIFAGDGSPLGAELTVNDVDGRMHIEPSVDADARGRFAVTWMTWEGGTYAVSYRLFAADGTPLTAALRAADGPPWCSGATVAMQPGGPFTIVYNVENRDSSAKTPEHPVEGGRPAEVWARDFASDGTPLGEPYRVHQQTEGRHALTIATSARQALWTADERFAVVWSGNAGADDDDGVALSLRGPHCGGWADAREVVPSHAAAASGMPDVYPFVPPEFDPNFVREPEDRTWVNRSSDFGFLGTQATGWTPPDPDIAVGPNHVVLVVNGEIRFRTLSGTSTFSQAIAGSTGFWGSVGAGGFVFDPTAVYDPHSGRFIVAAGELWNNNANSAICIAVSDDSDPNGTWYKYRWEVSSYGGFLDFPNLGVDKDAIYIANDFFNAPTGNFIWVIPKAPTLTGAPTSITGVRTSTGTRSLGNCKTYDLTAPAQYFATAYSGSSTKIALNAITDPLGTPTLHSFDVTVPVFSQPPDAAQLGTSNLADTVDLRIKNGVYRNGSLWLSHAIGEDSVARVRWYEIRMNGWPTSGLIPTLRQSGTLNLGPGEYTWMPDIHVDSRGNALLAFSRSSATQYVSVQRAVRTISDPLGTFEAPVTLQDSTSPETGSRWGDYSGVDQQPGPISTFWTHTEYRTSNWRTWVGSVVITQDCNGNGIEDTVDIAGGFSLDCNSNGVPDDCDIALGHSADCNGNGVPDECDTDCNADGIPDDCEIGAQSGLVGWYYPNADFTGTSHTRVDANVDFSWGNGTPWPDFDGDTFSVRWSGYVHTASASGVYTFSTLSDDGVRLWVNGQQLIDEWILEPPTEWAGSIALAGNRDYPIVLEYFDNLYGATIQLSWQPPGAAKAVIPSFSLYPGRDCNHNGVLDSCDIAQGTSPDGDGDGIPDECAGTKGDLNCDGLVNNQDIDAFVLALFDPAGYGAAYPACNILNGDLTGDGAVNNQDITPFVSTLFGQ